MNDLTTTLRAAFELLERATPGPWRYVPWHIEEADAAVRAPDGHLICCTSSDATSAAIVSAVNWLRDNAADIERALEDSARLDWLADPNNNIGRVQLPIDCVRDNLHSLRAAIDDAMDMREGHDGLPHDRQCAIFELGQFDCDCGAVR